jgi:hypothetical protein
MVTKNLIDDENQQCPPPLTQTSPLSIIDHPQPPHISGGAAEAMGRTARAIASTNSDLNGDH